MQHAKYPHLFSKGKVGKVTTKNRVIRNSMGTYLNVGKLCDVSDRNIKHAAEAAEGGPGIVFLDNCLIVDGYHMGLAAYDDTYIPGLSMIAQAMHDHGAVAGMQLAHPGRDMGFAGGDNVVAPSAVLPEIMINAGATVPRPLTIDEIHEIEEQYGQAAARVKQAGFDIVEVHGACGCLPTNFLSPHDNQRNDIYGGSLFNRQRFLVEVIRVIKRYVGPDFPVSVKLDMDDCEPDGIRLEECIDTCRVLEREGVALLNLVTATHVTANFSTSFYPWSYCADMAAKVKEQVHIPVMVTGAIQSPEAAEKILADGKADFVGTARQCLADQAWVEKARTGHEEDIRPCIRCQIGCTDRGILGHHPISCATNPTLFHYYEELYPKAETPKNVAVVGAGPAGCEAALTLKKRGHNVVVFEKREIGGTMIEAGAAWYKSDINRFIEYYRKQLEKQHIDVRMQEVTPQDIADGGYDACIVAIGGEPRKLNVPGIDKPIVTEGIDFLYGSKKVEGKSAVVVGGATTTAEIALDLAEKGMDVTIVKRGTKFLNPAGCQMDIEYTIRLHQLGVKLMTGYRLDSVTDTSAIAIDQYGETVELPCDNVVISAGFLNRPGFAEKLEEISDMDVYMAGDCKKVAEIPDATHAGYAVARMV